jgi:hypothetical protein
MSENHQNEKDTEALSIEQKNLLQKAQAYAKSLASKGLNNNKADPETKILRELSCHGDNDQLPPCSQRRSSEKFEGSYFCGACGCGDKKGTQLVDLTIDNKENYGKLDYPTVWCPLNMPGFQPYKPSKEEPEEVRNKRKEQIENRVSIEYIVAKSKGNPEKK